MSAQEAKPSDGDPDLEPMLPLVAEGLRTVLRDPGDLFKQLQQVSQMLNELAIAPSQPALVFRRAGKTQSREIGDALTVGRTSACDLSFPECAEMSRRQFGIASEGAHCVLTDSGSLNGTFVSGVRGRVDTRELRDGDLIESGGVTFVFVWPAKDMPAQTPMG